MTNQSSPITPPPELVEQWYVTADNASEDVIVGVANRAAQWSADQELEACCEWLVNKLTFREDGIRFAGELRAARRPKQSSLKEQALKALREAEVSGHLYVNGRSDTIRRALETL